MEQIVQQFLDQLSESGLLSEDDLAALRESLGEAPETLAEITETLVEQRKLTKFQADQISKGRGASLVLGNYLLVDEIGAGGMGKVYLAEHRRMKRSVALKTLPTAMIEDQQAVERFQREVQAAAQLTHPNIVTAYDADEADGTHFFVMEYVEGADLRKVVATRGPLSVAQAVEGVKQVAGGLDYAHRKGIVHRDIKPGNLLLDPEGTVKILDMGLARYQTSGEGDEGLTISGMAMGTADFMAPEQGMNAKNADARSDIYSLGCTLYFLLTGRKVYEGESIIEKIMAHQQQPIPDLSAIRPDVPSELAGIFRKMVAKQPEERFQSAGEVVESLTQLSGLNDSSGSGLESNTPLRALAGDAFGPTELSPSPLNQSANRTFVSSVYDDTVKQASEVEPALPHPPRRRWGLIAGGFLGFVILLAGLIIKLQTPAGYVVLEIDQPEIIGAQVLIDGDKSITIKTGNGTEKIRVRPDKKRHKLEVKMAGFKTFTEEFTFNTGSKKSIRVYLEPKETAADRGDVGTQPKMASLKENWALEFDGEAGYVTTPIRYDGTHPLTIEAFVYGHPTNTSRVVVAPGNPPNRPSHQSGALTFYTGNRADFSVAASGSVEPLVNAFGTLPSQPTAVHVAGVFDGEHASLFVNGVLKKRIPAKGLQMKLPTLLNIGASVVKPDHIHGVFDGIIDEVRISNVARYTEDFKPAKRFENDEYTLALYHFDEGNRNVLTDSSGNGNHGTIFGAKWVKVDGNLTVIEEGQAIRRFDPYARQWEVVKWLLSLKGRLTIQLDDQPWRLVTSAKNLPLNYSSFKVIDVQLAGNPELDGLDLSPLNELSSLQSVNLFGFDLNEEHIKAIGNCKSLEKLYISFSSINLSSLPTIKKSIEEFRKQVPRCEVFSEFGRFSSENNTSLTNASRNEPQTYEWPEDQPAAAIAPFTAEKAKQLQAAWANHLGVPVEMENSIGMKFRVIPPGEFLMGSPADEISNQVSSLMEAEKFYPNWRLEIVFQEGPQHRVVLTSPLQVGIYEVTRREFHQFVEATGYLIAAEKSESGGFGWNEQGLTQDSKFSWKAVGGSADNQIDDHAVLNLCWKDCVAFCEWLSEKEGAVYRLPTEAEWEYMCRAGTVDRFPFGLDESRLSEYAWYARSGPNSYSSVGKKKPNGFGLYDMMGNVQEWCQDGVAVYSASLRIDPFAKPKDSMRMLRGGAAGKYIASTQRPAARWGLIEEENWGFYGFRIVRTFEKFEPKKPESEGPAVAPKPSQSSGFEKPETTESEKTLKEE